MKANKLLFLLIILFVSFLAKEARAAAGDTSSCKITATITNIEFKKFDGPDDAYYMAGLFTYRDYYLVNLNITNIDKRKGQGPPCDEKFTQNIQQVELTAEEYDKNPISIGQKIEGRIFKDSESDWYQPPYFLLDVTNQNKPNYLLLMYILGSVFLIIVATITTILKKGGNNVNNSTNKK
ncbi:MAG: hypothetical protein WC528_03940 [Patescibacteria group bacterium]